MLFKKKKKKGFQNALNVKCIIWTLDITSKPAKCPHGFIDTVFPPF